MTAAPGAEFAHNPLRVTLTLPPGWVALPPSDAPSKGLLRRDPLEVLAREIVSSGAVVPALLGPTRDHLLRMAQADPNALGVATYIAAPTRTPVFRASFRKPSTTRRFHQPGRMHEEPCASSPKK